MFSYVHSHVQVQVFYTVNYGKGCSAAKYCIYLLTSFISFAGKFDTEFRRRISKKQTWICERTVLSYEETQISNINGSKYTE